MAYSGDLDRVAMVVLRHLRRPFFVIVMVYAIGVIGMALIPGRDVNGDTEYMSLFHAFYFFTYTATTTGFGEIPSQFSDEQRLWAVFCLYTGVIAWFYAIGSTIRLLQNPHFISAVSEHTFARTVRRIDEPFFIICGFGDTGSLLARGLSDHHMAAVIIDSDPERIKALALRDYKIRMPGLCADASVPRHLVDAGIKKSNCKAVVVLNNDDDVSLKITVMAKFLNPQVQVICSSTSRRHEDHLKEFDGVTVIDPFEIFAQLLSMAITHPLLHNLNSWLVRAYEIELGKPLEVPSGDWILCGYGRMGQWIDKYMTAQGVRTAIIDPHADDAASSSEIIREHADRGALERAGIRGVAGIVAGTDNDSGNLGILLSVKALNPDVFTIVRQNNHENQLAFDAADADLTLQSSLTTARRILKHLISPLIQTLIDYLLTQDESTTRRLIGRLDTAIGEKAPHLWRVNLCDAEAAAAFSYLHAGGGISLERLTRDPREPGRSLECVPLMIQRAGECLMLPDDSHKVSCGDEIVFCGTAQSRRLLHSSLNNPYTLHYLATGIDPPRGWFFTWLANRTRPMTV